MPPDEPHDDGRTGFVVEAPGADEVAVVPWPILMRRKVLARVEESDRYPWLVLATVLFGLFTVTFTITILSNALPRIAGDLDSNVSTLTWVVTGPLLAFAIMGPAAGKLGDLHGHRRLYVASMTCAGLFAAATVLAWNPGSLIVFRIAGAATGAATGPAALALINHHFPPQRRAQAMGFWAMVGAGGPVIGVVAGGPIVEAFGWRWIFAAQAPLAIAGVVAALFFLPGQRRRPTDVPPFDVPGAVWLAVGTSSLLLAINRGPVWGWSAPPVVAGFVLAPAAIALFVRVERRSPHPLVPVRYLTRRNFAAPLTSQFLVNVAYMGGFIITPLLLQSEFGYGETRTGSLLIARPLAFAITGPIAGSLAIRIGERTAAVAGAASVLASMVWLASLDPSQSDWSVVGALAMSGVGLGASSPALAAVLANSVDTKDLGIAGATQQMATQIGFGVGIQVLQTVQAARAGAVGSLNAFGDAYLVGGGVAAMGVVAALFVRSTRAMGAPEGAHAAAPARAFATTR